MLEPLISIIIPVLNGASFLERCFLTLDMQTYPNLEVIFIGKIYTIRNNIRTKINSIKYFKFIKNLLIKKN